MSTHELQSCPQKKRARHRHSLRQQRREALPRFAYTVAEWASITATSKALIYRQMQAW